jgi:exonuclease SbcC
MSRSLRDERRRQLEQLQARQNDLAAKLEKANTAIVKARQLLDEAEATRAGAAQLSDAQTEVARLDGLRDQYDALLDRRRTHEQALHGERARLEQERARVEGELRSLQERAARRPKLEQELHDVAARLEQLAPAAGELEQARRSRAELLERSRQANQLRLSKLEIQSSIDKRRDSLIASREELKRRIKAAVEQTRDEPRWRADLEHATQERTRLEAEQQRAEALRADEAQAAELVGAQRAACDTIKLQGEQLNEKIELLNATDLASCPLCGNELGHDGLAHIIDEYQRERNQLRTLFAQKKREADTTAKQLRELQSLIGEVRQRASGLTESAGRIARLERDLRAADETRARQTEDQRLLDDVQMQILKGDFEQGLRAELARVEAELAAIGGPELIETEMKRAERRVTELEQQLSQQADLRAQMQRRRDEIRQIDDDDPALHEQELRQRELTTTLQMDDYAHAERLALRRLEGEVTALGYTPDFHTAARNAAREFAHWADKLTRLERAEDWLTQNEPVVARDEEELRRLEGEIGQATAELRDLESELRGLDLEIRSRNEAQVRLRECQGANRAAERDLFEKQASLKRAEEATEALLEREAERKRLADRKGLFDELTQAFGKKGVQALLIETAIPEVEREANTLLGGMTDNQMHLTFETQGETKKGEVTETLDIRIADALGTRDYDAYSGGESFRVDFAIRVALAKLLARRAGARLETLVIDEGFGSQDARGRERLVEAITSIQRDFRQILVVTHIQELKDMFPVQIEVIKTPDGSRWSIA